MSNSTLRFEQVDRSADRVLGNLFEHYLHDMAEWFEFDTAEDGAYAYPTENLWNNGCDVYLAYAAAVPVAFALVDDAGHRAPQPGTRDLKEFFVIRRHRRSGVGSMLARHVWDRYPVPWLVRVYQRNRPAVPFWRQTVAAYTEGRFDEQTHIGDDGKEWVYFTFHSGGQRRSD